MQEKLKFWQYKMSLNIRFLRAYLDVLIFFPYREI